MNNFKHKESYLHNLAKGVLVDWIIETPQLIGLSFIPKIEKEVKFYLNERLLFVPDITVYSSDEPYMWIEVIHESDLSCLKLYNMQFYRYKMNVWPRIITIEAMYIMKQIERPGNLRYMDYG